jgi:hypothetical protein
MQVMNSEEFDQKNVLIGQAAKTEAFGVSADPMLMSMLSTGLYANPLRTMIQEIMFNAWDAHRMGNCQDRPIDVYLNDTSGLIVRDYGPGIKHEDMVPVYCIYGNSTKRNDQGQTGGFGLGCKSPYAYTDSFNVTSLHQGKKSMYVMNRVSEENGGAPGMTPIIRDVPTDETGLIVTVPMKNDRDLERARLYIHDVLFLSGIKINLHYLEKDVQTIEAFSVAPNQWINDDHDNDRGLLYAVYGGVRYKIEEEDSYKQEYKFLERLGNSIGTFYIGFPPDSLTPLPNREGLNLSEKSVEAIKTQLEGMMESFQTVCKPAARFVLEKGIEELSTFGIQPHFLVRRWDNIGAGNLHSIVYLDFDNMEDVKSAKPKGISDNLWMSMVKLAYAKTSLMAELIGYNDFNKMLGIVFAKQYPEYRKYIFGFMSGKVMQEIREDRIPAWIQRTNQALRQVERVTDQKVDLRIRIGSPGQWIIHTGNRGGKKINNLPMRKQEIIKKQLSNGTYKAPTKPALDRLWSNKTGEEFSEPMMDNHIIIAKTATALNETQFSGVREYFASNVDWDKDPFSRRSVAKPELFNEWRRYIFAPAIVVHARKGGYDKAKEVLTRMGYTVIEADEPEEKVKKPTAADFIGPRLPAEPKKKKEPTFPVVNTHFQDWACPSSPEISDPDCYFHCTVSMLTSYSSYCKPSGKLMSHVMKRWPKTVILHNKKREGILTKKNVPLLSTVVDDAVTKLLKNEARIEKMYLHYFLVDNCTLPSAVLEIPEIQKLMGVPYIRTKEKEAFHDDWRFLHVVRDERSDYLQQSTRRKVRDVFEKYQNSAQTQKILENCDKCNFFDSFHLRRHVNGMKPGEVLMFSQKLARFIRTV